MFSHNQFFVTTVTNKSLAIASKEKFTKLLIEDTIAK